MGKTQNKELKISSGAITEYNLLICALLETFLHDVSVCTRCPLFSPDVSAIDDIRVLGQTEDSIQVDWKNPQAEVDYFRLKHTDLFGQEEGLKVQMSQEARTKHTIVGKSSHRRMIISMRSKTYTNLVIY